jgi:hypothetical protein
MTVVGGPITASVIVGGINNSIVGADNNVIIGGNANNITSGSNSMVCGAISTSGVSNAFVWGDGSLATAAPISQSFTIRATGGVNLLGTTSLNLPQVTGAGLGNVLTSDALGNGTWQASSAPTEGSMAVNFINQGGSVWAAQPQLGTVKWSKTGNSVTLKFENGLNAGGAGGGYIRNGVGFELPAILRPTSTVFFTIPVSSNSASLGTLAIGGDGTMSIGAGPTFSSPFAAGGVCGFYDVGVSYLVN